MYPREVTFWLLPLKNKIRINYVGIIRFSRESQSWCVEALPTHFTCILHVNLGQKHTCQN